MTRDLYLAQTNEDMQKPAKIVARGAEDGMQDIARSPQANVFLSSWRQPDITKLPVESGISRFM